MKLTTKAQRRMLEELSEQMKLHEFIDARTWNALFKRGYVTTHTGEFDITCHITHAGRAALQEEKG